MNLVFTSPLVPAPMRGGVNHQWLSPKKNWEEYLSSKEKCMIHIVVELFWPYEF